VEIFPGFAAAEVLYDDDGSVKGVATGNMGIGKDGEPTGDFQLGMELHGKYTVFAEGARGHLGKQLLAKFKLDRGQGPAKLRHRHQGTVGMPAAKAKPGLVVHTAGWPLDDDTYGGGFLYHLEGNKVTLGFVIGLDYQNPWLSPFEEMQRWKTHPSIKRTTRRRQAPRLWRPRHQRPVASSRCPRRCSPAVRWSAVTRAS
jgi:electron-transferring-flavoprotein dehydrogenase